MIGEYDERYSTTAISSAIDENAPFRISCVTGSIAHPRSRSSVPPGAPRSVQPAGT